MPKSLCVVQSICEIFPISYPESRAIKVHQSQLELCQSHCVLANRSREAIYLVEVCAKWVGKAIDIIQVQLLTQFVACKRNACPCSVYMDPEVRIVFDCANATNQPLWKNQWFNEKRRTNCTNFLHIVICTSGCCANRGNCKNKEFSVPSNAINGIRYLLMIKGYSPLQMSSSRAFRRVAPRNESLSSNRTSSAFTLRPRISPAFAPRECVCVVV